MKTQNLKLLPIQLLHNLTLLMKETFRVIYFRSIVNRSCTACRAQPDWAYEFPDRTGLDTQISWTGPAGPDGIRTYIFNILPNKYGLSIMIW